MAAEAESGARTVRDEVPAFSSADYGAGNFKTSAAGISSSEAVPTEVFLFGEIQAAYNSGFYPGTVSRSEIFLKNYPFSVFLPQVLVFEGESLFRLSRFSEAEDVLEKALSAAKDDEKLLTASSYWLARTALSLKDLSSARNLFYKAASLSKENEKSSFFYASSLFYAGKTCVFQEDYFSAVPLFEFVIANGPLYSLEEYEEAAVLLAGSYFRTRQFEKVLKIYPSFAALSPPVNDKITLYAGDCQAALGNYRAAYDLYEKVLAGSERPLVISALQKAYTLSSSHPAEVKKDPGEILSSVGKKFSNFSDPDSSDLGLGRDIDIIDEFWLRLAIDSFRSKDYPKAKAYLSSINENASEPVRYIRAVYDAELILKGFGTERSAAGKTDKADKIAGGASANSRSVENSAGENLRAGALAAETYLLPVLEELESAKKSFGSKAPDGGNKNGVAGAFAVSGESAGCENDSIVLVYEDVLKRLARYSALRQNWDACFKYLSRIKSPDADSLYWKAFAEYKTGNTASAVSSLETEIEGSAAWKHSGESRLLYALVLSDLGGGGKSGGNDGKNGDPLEKALAVFSDLEKDSLLSDQMRLNYVNLLIRTGKNKEASASARLSLLAEAPYYAALADFNLGDWNSAVKEFSKYLSDKDAKPKYRAFAQFYCGYAQYRNSDFAAAYKTLVAFAGQYPSHELAWNAYMTSASAAVQSGNLKGAESAAEEALKISISPNKRRKASLLCAGIYSDMEQFEKAASLLKPYSVQKDEFALQCRYVLAQIYEKDKKIKEADALYASIIKDFSLDALSEDASYRRGELYYAAKDYNAAVNRFEEYIRKFPSGRFYDAAMYFCAESLAALGFTDKAVLQYELFLSTVPESAYRYGAVKNLCLLYRQTGDYRSALAEANRLLSEYGRQAKDDKIDEQIKELEQLVSGSDIKIVQKISEYENSGGIDTPAGRKAGTELAALYSKSPDMQEKAISLSAQLLAVQKKNLDSESLFAAKNAVLLASYRRRQEKNAESAKLYLDAASYYRMSAYEDSAAAALYGAVEAFDAASQYGNAKETASLLEKLYPESAQNAGAKRIVEKYRM
ncbi:tetratricopeptide repeat protein [Treponema parvum]|uniref:Tetratricopeptide repeat protein n=1 Tax=Treponema parvum TaxID=138851 RepID=A0A975F0T8_9SPIR|nr:tetratricopeptide repeat protein [Treponema parvum]QTQ12366.1 tetratricopeptide repeat protein [Treponema parvum]